MQMQIYGGEGPCGGGGAGSDGGVQASPKLRLEQRRRLEDRRQHPLHRAPQAQGVRVSGHLPLIGFIVGSNCILRRHEMEWA